MSETNGHVTQDLRDALTEMTRHILHESGGIKVKITHFRVVKRANGIATSALREAIESPLRVMMKVA
jgi:hypothetical protein